MVKHAQINDLLRDFNFSKAKAKLLGSRLQTWNLLDNSTKISRFRKREKSKFNLEANLLHNSNLLSAVSMTYSVDL